MRKVLFAALLALCAVAARGQDSDAPALKDPKLSDYIVDIDAGTVSAGGLVGLEQTAVQQVESSQDLMVALKPFSSGSSSRAGFGLAITPARTAFLGVSAQDYYDKPLVRALSSFTVSYAENGATITSVKYRRSAVSADLFYYLDREKDPIVVAHQAFGECDQSDALGLLGRAIRQRKAAEAGGDKDEIAKAKAAEAKAQKAYDDVVSKCLDEGTDTARLKSPWNATRVALSLGAGWIRPEDTSGSRESLGRSITLSGLWGMSKNGAAYLSLRRTTNEADLTTLGGTVQEKDSTLAALRLVYGSREDNGDTKLLAEVSNAKKNEVTASNNVFKVAVGADKRIGKGAWLQFRLGRHRAIDSTTTETTGIFNLTFAPSAGLFK